MATSLYSRLAVALAVALAGFATAPAHAATAAPQTLVSSGFLGSYVDEARHGWCRRSGAEVKIGDFNGDGRDDLLCHWDDGHLWIDFNEGDEVADFGAVDNDSDWQRDAGWCKHDGAKLFVGDFDGDGQDDLLCHDVDVAESTGGTVVPGGHLWLDYASNSGEFNGTNWSRDAGWCKHDDARLHVGDFDGDGQDDLLCHDTDSGELWIDYASNSGELNGTDWHRDASWCKLGGAALKLGDFDGDGRTDLLCHEQDGKLWIDFASNGGQFNGADWERDSDWCTGSGDRIHVGDFDGDGRYDLLCHSEASGSLWIDLASPNGKFNGTDRFVEAGWCRIDDARLHVGRFNLTRNALPDTRTDLLCHNRGDGSVWTAQSGLCQASTTCNGNGDCSPTGDCLCRAEYAGSMCSTCSPNHYGYPACTYCHAATTCNGHGSCNAIGGCVCAAGYTGASCETAPRSVPALSLGGMAMMALGLLVPGATLLRRRRGLS